jgi:hypothetical protein
MKVKSIVVYLMVLSIGAQSVVRTAWTLHYQWNRALYLRNCENLDKPEMKCDGKCYLKKNIAASENNSSKAPELPAGFRQFKEIQLFLNPFTGLISMPIFNEQLAASTFYYQLHQVPQPDLPTLFQPPDAV